MALYSYWNRCRAVTDLVWGLAAKYKSLKIAPICCGLMMLCLTGMGLPLYFGYRDSNLASLEERYGKEYS